ncbi:MAG: hypothetical protein IKQ75_04875 [Bacteroidales bacterium]|nr:hypothetical protein [Bacteroidales bacterium]MBR6161183.1 hypothetical protein [Bacteroidales bacterium]
MYMNESLFKDFLSNREILWLGINFSHAKFTRQGLDFSQEIMQHYFQDWNRLILNDQKKYDIRMSFRKPIMQYDLSLVTKINKTAKASNILVSNLGLKDQLNEDQLRSYVAQHAFPTALRFALIFVVESFDSMAKTASIWVIILQTADSEVVLCEKFMKPPGGFGARNYWARTFYNLLFDIKNHDYLRWENMVKEQELQHTDIINPII